MFTKNSSSEWLHGAALLVMFLLELILPPGDALPSVPAERDRTSLLNAVRKSGTASATTTRACTSRIIAKIVSYDSAPAIRDILLVSDLNDDVDFGSTPVRLRTLVPFDFNLARIDRTTLGTTAAKGELIERMNRGLGIVRMDRELFRVVFSSGHALTLGEAVIRAKNSVKDSDVRIT